MAQLEIQYMIKHFSSIVHTISSISNVELNFSDALLNEMSMYYFNGEGKFIRPRLTGTMAGAVNCHLGVSIYKASLHLGSFCLYDCL